MNEPLNAVAEILVAGDVDQLGHDLLQLLYADILAQGLGDFARGNIRLRLPAPERRLGRLVPTVDLHARRSQPVEAVPFELPFPGTNFLDR